MPPHWRHPLPSGVFYIPAGATIVTERETRAFENGDAILNTEARDQFLYLYRDSYSGRRTQRCLPTAVLFLELWALFVFTIVGGGLFLVVVVVAVGSGDVRCVV